MTEIFDPITLEILWQRLVSIVDEADASVARTAFSSLLRDAHDYTCMFTDSRGQELVQGTFCTPGQAGAMALGVKRLINSIALDTYQPGDVYIVNDPWLLAVPYGVCLGVGAVFLALRLPFRPLAVVMIGLGCLGIIELFILDHWNILLQYEHWIHKGMPDKPF